MRKLQKPLYLNSAEVNIDDQSKWRETPTRSQTDVSINSQVSLRSTSRCEMGDRLKRRVQTSKLSKRIANYAIEHEIVQIPQSEPGAIFGVPSDTHSRESWNAMLSEMVDFARHNVPKGEKPVLLPPVPVKTQTAPPILLRDRNAEVVDKSVTPWSPDDITGDFDLHQKGNSTTNNSQHDWSTINQLPQHVHSAFTKHERLGPPLKHPNGRKSELFLFHPNDETKTIDHRLRSRNLKIPNSLLPGNARQNPHSNFHSTPDPRKTRTHDGVIRHEQTNPLPKLLTVPSAKDDLHFSTLKQGKILNVDVSLAELHGKPNNTQQKDHLMSTCTYLSGHSGNGKSELQISDHKTKIPIHSQHDTMLSQSTYVSNVLQGRHVKLDQKKARITEYDSHLTSNETVSQASRSRTGEAQNPLHQQPTLVTTQSTPRVASSAAAWNEMLHNWETKHGELAHGTRLSSHPLRRQPRKVNLNDTRVTRTEPPSLPSYPLACQNTLSDIRDETPSLIPQAMTQKHMRSHAQTKPLPPLPQKALAVVMPSTSLSESTLSGKATCVEQPAKHAHQRQEKQLTSNTEPSVPIMSRSRPPTGASSKRFVDQDYVDPATELMAGRKDRKRRDEENSGSNGKVTKTSTQTITKTKTQMSSEAELRKQLLMRKAQFEEKQMRRRFEIAGLAPPCKSGFVPISSSTACATC